MGIKSVWNGGTPSAIPWTNTEDIVKAIKKESTTIGTTDHYTAAKVRKFLTIDDSFYLLQTYFP